LLIARSMTEPEERWVQLFQRSRRSTWLTGSPTTLARGWITSHPTLFRLER
jgi:hypothetical protein